MTTLPLHRRSPSPQRAERAPLVIGLVNNMPDAALRTTERQFRELLCAAAGGASLRLRVFSSPELPRSPAARQYITDCHEDIDALWASEVDGLIVTGTEPRTPQLVDEPSWPTLTRLADWAEKRTGSTIWSCLAAHTAVHYLDGIVRRPIGRKLSGVFRSRKVADHPLLDGAPPRWPVPHSRYNTLDEIALVTHGYRILARSPEAGVDMFVRPGKSLFLFLQGHPEYDAGALLREYRRDVKRFLAGDSDCYPEMPCGYFDAGASEALLAFRERALHHRDCQSLADFPEDAVRHGSTGAWCEAAVRLYGNWLSYLATRRDDGIVWSRERLRQDALIEAAPAHP